MRKSVNDGSLPVNGGGRGRALPSPILYSGQLGHRNASAVWFLALWPPLGGEFERRRRLPFSIVAAAATPGGAACAKGLIIAQRLDLSLVSETNPAKPGDYFVIYLAGLGAVNHPVAHGAATPGTVSLYQVSFQVPLNTPNGDLQLVVSQGGFRGMRILPVHN
jgi:hypothetical protein